MTEQEVRPSPEGNSPKFDALIVLGKNIGLDWDRTRIGEQRFHLSTHSRVNVLAAGILYMAGVSDHIIFSSGKTAGSLLPSEAEAMKDRLLSIFPDIPEAAVILDDISLNTFTNAKEVQRIMREREFRTAALVSVGFHLERAQYLFKKAGLPVRDLIPSEWILHTRRSRYAEGYIASDLYRRELERERKLLRYQKLPFGPQLFSLMTRFTRNPNKP